MFILTPINKIISKFERKVKNKHKVTATKDELVEIFTKKGEKNVHNGRYQGS